MGKDAADGRVDRQRRQQQQQRFGPQIGGGDAQVEIHGGEDADTPARRQYWPFTRGGANGVLWAMARSEPKSRPNLLFVVAACALVLFTAEVVFEGDGGFGLFPRGPVLGGPFTLTDQHGARVDDGHFADRFRLMYFGYSRCLDGCLDGLETIATTLRALGPEAEAIAPIFVTLDPDWDTPAVLATLAERVHPRLVALTGTRAEIAAVAAAFGVPIRPSARGEGGAASGDDDGAPSAELPMLFLMAPDGDYIAQFPATVTSEALAEQLRAYM